MKRIVCAALFMTLVCHGLAAAFSRSGNQRRSRPPCRTRLPKSSSPTKAEAFACSREIPSSRSAFSTISRALSLPRCRCRSSRRRSRRSLSRARSYLQRALASPKHEGADICADSACCQAYLTPEQLKSSWGDKYAQYSEKISAAVRATDGEYLSYDGKPALAAFHSSSDGATEDAGAIWSDVPYLKSVSSPETGDSVRISKAPS